MNSLSLFSSQLAIEVHGNIKPDAGGLKELKSYLRDNEQNLLLVVMPKQDSSSLKTAFFQVIDANGVNVALSANYPKDRQNGGSWLPAGNFLCIHHYDANEHR